MTKFRIVLVLVLFLAGGVFFLWRNEPGLFALGFDASDDKAEIQRLYIEEKKLTNAAWLGVPLNAPNILTVDKERMALYRLDTNSQPEGKNSKLIANQVVEYDHHKDSEWKKRCIAAEQGFLRLIEKYKKLEGEDSRTAAFLGSHLARLYRYSGSGELEWDIGRILLPKCPDCGRNDRIGIQSPPPNSTIEYDLKYGWWFCRYCDNSFQAKQEK